MILRAWKKACSSYADNMEDILEYIFGLFIMLSVVATVTIIICLPIIYFLRQLTWQ